jgi:transcriptional regulator with XRE-family HTH domain
MLYARRMLDIAVPPPLAPEDRVPADRLVAALGEVRMSQSELARRLGLTVVAVNRWCRGKAPISTSRWIAIASVLGLPVSWQPGPSTPTTTAQ